MVEHEVLEDLYYTKNHEWAKVKDSTVTIGITDYAQDKIGDVVFVELPDTGVKVEQVFEEEDESSEAGIIESIKAVSPMFSPISGEVVETNDELLDDPEKVNRDPYGDGWMFKVEPKILDEELKNLMNAEAYGEFLESEEE